MTKLKYQMFNFLIETNLINFNLHNFSDECESIIHSSDNIAPVGYINFKKVHLQPKNVSRVLKTEKTTTKFLFDFQNYIILFFILFQFSERLGMFNVTRKVRGNLCKSTLRLHLGDCRSGASRRLQSVRGRG